MSMENPTYIPVKPKLNGRPIFDKNDPDVGKVMGGAKIDVLSMDSIPTKEEKRAAGNKNANAAADSAAEGTGTGAGSGSTGGSYTWILVVLVVVIIVLIILLVYYVLKVNKTAEPIPADLMRRGFGGVGPHYMPPPPQKNMPTGGETAGPRQPAPAAAAAPVESPEPDNPTEEELDDTLKILSSKFQEKSMVETSPSAEINKIIATSDDEDMSHLETDEIQSFCEQVIQIN